MTLAAKELHLTQSGISQQIKSLESALDVVLFDRINRRILPTDKADRLYKYCSRGIIELEQILESLSEIKTRLSGKIKIGFPPVFGKHVLIPLLARFHRLHQDVSFELCMGLASELAPMLLDGRLDFAFMDSFAKDPQLVSKEVAREYLDFVIHKDLFSQYGEMSFDLDYFRQLPFAAYVHGEPIIRSWFQHTFGSVPHGINVIATIIDSSVIAKLVTEGVAVGILPEPLALELKQNNASIQILKAESRAANNIHLCHLAKRTLGLAAGKCLDDISLWLDVATS